MISISKTIADRQYGNVIVRELSGSEISSASARISRTALLDGTVYINDFGFCHGDRTFSIKAVLTDAQEMKLRNMLQNWRKVIVSTVEGVFTGTLESLNIYSGTATIKILIKQKEK